MSEPFDQIDIQPSQNVAMDNNMHGGRSAVQNMQCIGKPLGCGRDISFEDFDSWDRLTQKEYTMSGWCNTCQDRVFKEPEDDEPEVECFHPDQTCEQFWDAPHFENDDIVCVLTCTCNTPCCEADIGVGVIDCGSQHCQVHGTKE